MPRMPLLLFLALSILACRSESILELDEVPVEVGMVALDNSNSPVVILEEQGGERWLPIWVGSFEARSIASEMDAQEPPRPNTHDLAESLIARLQGEVVRVVVTELRGGTYYAILSLRADGQVLELDSRPSDAIAIALRTGAPIFVRAPVFDAAGEGTDSEDAGRRIRWSEPGPGGIPHATSSLEL